MPLSPPSLYTNPNTVCPVWLAVLWICRGLLDKPSIPAPSTASLSFSFMFIARLCIHAPSHPSSMTACRMLCGSRGRWPSGSSYLLVWGSQLHPQMQCKCEKCLSLMLWGAQRRDGHQVYINMLRVTSGKALSTPKSQHSGTGSAADLMGSN